MPEPSPVQTWMVARRIRRPGLLAASVVSEFWQERGRSLDKPSGQTVVTDAQAVRHEPVFWTEILSFAALLATMLVATIAMGVALQGLDRAWVVRYMGIAGTILMLLSFLYSLRKRNILIRRGSLRNFLVFHEICAWLGALLVLVHSGVRVNGLLAWLATSAVVVAVISGLTGRCLLQRARKQLLQKKGFLLRQGKTEDEAERVIFWEVRAVSAMAKWRAAHLPITWTVWILAGIHVLVALMFWPWA